MAISEDGLVLNLMLRLSFLIPFAVLNFVCGVTEMHFGKFLASLVALIPGAVIYLFLGTSLPDLAALLQGKVNTYQHSALALGFIVTGAVIGVLSAIYVTYASKQKFNEIVRNEES